MCTHKHINNEGTDKTTRKSQAKKLRLRPTSTARACLAELLHIFRFKKKKNHTACFVQHHLEPVSITAQQSFQAHSKINPKLVVAIYAHKQKQQAIATNTKPSFSSLISQTEFPL